MTEEDDLTIRDIEQATQYKDTLNYQAVLTRQMDRIARYRDTNLKQYASSIDTLIMMLDPDEIYPTVAQKRDRLGLLQNDYDSMNADKQKKFDELWVFINKQLKDHGMIFRTSRFAKGKMD